MISKFEDKSKLKDICMQGHDFFDRLKKRGVPLVAHSELRRLLTYSF
jgi:hypothetical protein